jgi:hypothetical protein
VVLIRKKYFNCFYRRDSYGVCPIHIQAICGQFKINIFQKSMECGYFLQNKGVPFEGMQRQGKAIKNSEDIAFSLHAYDVISNF